MPRPRWRYAQAGGGHAPRQSYRQTQLTQPISGQNAPAEIRVSPSSVSVCRPLRVRGWFWQPYSWGSLLKNRAVGARCKRSRSQTGTPPRRPLTGSVVNRASPSASRWFSCCRLPRCLFTFAAFVLRLGVLASSGAAAESAFFRARERLQSRVSHLRSGSGASLRAALQ